IAQTSWNEITPISDAVLSQTSGTQPRFWFNQDMKIFAAYAGGASAFNGRIYTPSKWPNYIRPINPTSMLPPTPPLLATFDKFPLQVPKVTEVIMEGYQSSAGVQDFIGLAWLTGTGLDAVPQGEVTTVYGTSGTAAVLRTWTEISM